MAYPSVVELMRELVQIHSVFPQEQIVSDFIARKLSDYGCEVTRVESAPNRYSLVATTKPSKKYLGFYGHMDTVPAASDYTRDPWTVQFDGDIARGLGVCDMKGGLACILEATKFACERGIPVKATFGVDEENISVGAHSLVDSKLLTDISFMIVAESGQVLDTERAYSVGYGRKGRIVIRATVHGKKAHAAEYRQGVNAIEQAAKLLPLLSTLNLPVHPRLGESSLIIQRMYAEADSFSVPDTCAFEFSLMSSPGVTSQEVMERVRKLAQDNGINLSIEVAKRPTPYCEAYEINLENPFLKQIQASIFQNDDVQPVYNPSVADECIFANRLGLPVLSLGPIGAGDHTAEEWVKLSSLERCAQVMRQIVELYGRAS